MGRLSPQRVASAEAQNAFDELEETTPLLDSEQFLDIPRVIRIEPFRVNPPGSYSSDSNAGGSPPRSSRGRRSATPKALSSSCRTGTRWRLRVRPVRLSRNLRVAASVDDPVARILSRGNPSAPIFSRLPGSGSWWTSSRISRERASAHVGPYGKCGKRRVGGPGHMR